MVLELEIEIKECNFRGIDYDDEKTEAMKSYADLANCSVVINNILTSD